MADPEPPPPDQQEEEDIFADSEDLENPFGDVERMKEDKPDLTAREENQPDEYKPDEYLEPVSSEEPNSTPGLSEDVHSPRNDEADPKEEEELDTISVESVEDVKQKPPELLVAQSKPPAPKSKVASEYEDPDALPELDGDLTIAVSDPEKMGDGMGAYMVYRITTKTTMAAFKSSEVAVRRRFSDFLGLYARLVDQHAHKGILIPPPPEKSVLGMTKVKFSKENQSETEFIERRRSYLERFLNRIALQPELRADATFIDFLENPNELPKSKGTSAMSGAGMMRLFKNVGDVVKAVATKKGETDQWFETKIEEYTVLDTKLKALHESLEETVVYRRDLVIANSVGSKSIAVLSNVEEQNRSVSHALARLSEVEDRVSQLHHQQYKADLYIFTETIKDYVGLMGSIRQMFLVREKVQQNLMSTQSALVKKKESEMKLKAQGKPDKILVVQTEIEDLERKVEAEQKSFEEISERVKKEVMIFETRRSKEMKQKLIGYLEELLMQQEENYLKEYNQLLEEFRSLDVGVYSVTADPQAHVDQAIKDWGLEYEVYSDPAHTLRNYLKEEGLIEVKVSGGEGSTDSSFYKAHPNIKKYKHGVLQPGVLCVNSEGQKLYSWAIDPAFMNLGGATDRPVPADIWSYVKSRLSGELKDSDPVPKMNHRGKSSVLF